MAGRERQFLEHKGNRKQTLEGRKRNNGHVSNDVHYRSTSPPPSSPRADTPDAELSPRRLGREMLECRRLFANANDNVFKSPLCSFPSSHPPISVDDSRWPLLASRGRRGACLVNELAFSLRHSPERSSFELFRALSLKSLASRGGRPHIKSTTPAPPPAAGGSRLARHPAGGLIPPGRTPPGLPARTKPIT